MRESILKTVKALTAWILLISVVCAGAIPAQAAAPDSSITAEATQDKEVSGLHVKKHSQKAIRDFIKKHSFSITKAVSYAKKPVVKASGYKAGQLKKSSLKDGLNALNTARYIAGIPANVKLDDNYNSLAQAAALVNAANGQLAHYPSKPSGMSDSLYKKGKKGASASNLLGGSWISSSLACAVLCEWMDDSDLYNITGLGHRRWILNPAMEKTGFGHVSHYSAMYALDNASVADETDYYGVAWPAQNMPLDYFNDSQAWSVNMGDKFAVNIDDVKVTLTRSRDGKTWKFSKDKSDGYFNVNNSYYGMTGCIIFCPENIKYRAGDKFDVKITGFDPSISYSVKFFKL